MLVACAPDVPEQAVDSLISKIFSLFLVTGRPLHHYDATFMLPLDLRLNGELEARVEDIGGLQVKGGPDVKRHRLKLPHSLLRDQEEHVISSDDAAHAQAYEFFHTHLRDQIFETDAAATDSQHPGVEPIQHWRIPHARLEHWQLHLVDEEPRERVTGTPQECEITRAKIRDVSLYRYFNGLFVLSLRVNMEDCPQEREIIQWSGDETKWWHSLVFTDEQLWSCMQDRQINRWLRYSKLTRILFADFQEQKDERKIAVSRLWKGPGDTTAMTYGSHFSEVVLHLLGLFLPLPTSELNRSTRLSQVADPRMFVHAAYALCGPPPKDGQPEMEEFERLFSYALYVDERSDGILPDRWVYDKTYTQCLMSKQVLRRWQGLGVLSGFTNYSSVFMGFGEFFTDVIASVHVPYIYAKLQIPTLLYRTTLELFDRRITQATTDLRDNDIKSRAFANLRKDFIEFTNNYWFRQLSPQTQGEEICNRMMEAQGLDAKYELVKDEMERADEFSTTLRDQWFQERADIAGKIAGILAVAALVLAVVVELLSSLESVKSRVALLILIGTLAGCWYVYTEWRKKKDS